MPTIGMTIGKMGHQIYLCSMSDVVTRDGVMSLVREGVAPMWARIEPKKASMFTREGFYINPTNRSRPLDLERTHIIVFRNRPDLNITSAAWVFERRRKSAPRWYKVLGFKDYVSTVFGAAEDLRFTQIDCILYEHRDHAIGPARPGTQEQSAMTAKPMPEGVDL